MRVANRVLIAELDSPAQARRFAESGTRQAIVELTGMLRVGMLVSSTVLVTDAMLLDGAYFIALGPEGVLSELGTGQARYPLTITGRYPSLREGLEKRVENEEFVWSFPGAGGGDDVPRHVRRSWDEWLRFVESGIIRYEQQGAESAPLRIGPAPVRSVQDLETIKDCGLGGVRHRSEAWRILDSLPLSTSAVEEVRRWWNDAYLRMIAENAGADWIGFEADSRVNLAIGSEDVELPLSSGLLEWARNSTPATIAVAWDASHAQRDALRRRPDWRRMRNLAFTASQVATGSTRPAVLWSSYGKLAIAVVALALAAPGLRIDSIDSPLTWLAFVGAIATTVPYDSLAALWRLKERDPRTRLVLHRGIGT